MILRAAATQRESYVTRHSIGTTLSPNEVNREDGGTEARSLVGLSRLYQLARNGAWASRWRSGTCALREVTTSTRVTSNTYLTELPQAQQ